MPALRLRASILAVALLVIAAVPGPATARPGTAAPTSPYALSALALLGADGADVELTVSSATAPLPDQFEMVQVKVWPLGDGPVETRNFFDVPAVAGKATLPGFSGISRLQRVQVRVHVKDGSQNVLEAETVGQYRALGAISSDHPEATKAGVAMLRAGGNAFDAAVAVLFALNVTQPHLTGIGGSANIAIHTAAGDDYAIDARERAPAKTTADIYTGRNLDDVSVNGFSVGVPGTLRAVEVMLDRWGTKPLAETLQPAIDLAANGFTVGTFLAQDLLALRVARFQPETKAIFLPGGVALKAGDRLVQPQLADTLRLIARDGPSAFYLGDIAAAIVEAQKRHSINGGEGRMTLADLAAYDVVVRSASHLNYRGYDVYSAAPSSHGGQVLLESLGLLEDPRFPIGNVEAGYGFGTRFTIHAMAEALRLSITDREWVGDPAFFPVPESQLLSEAYLRARSALIQPFPVRMQPEVQPGNPFDFPASAEPPMDEAAEGGHTTHFSIIDKYGNVVSFTTTLADSFGSGITVPGYGFVLNDSLRLFNFTPRGPNDAGPNKRPAGSMTPTVIVKDGEPFAATGTYGSLFIPSLVLNIVLDLVDHHMPLQQAVNSSRIWMQTTSGPFPANHGVFAWNRGRPGGIAFQSSEIEALRGIGPPPPNRFPALNPPPRDDVFGSLASVAVEPGTFALQGAADARLPDATATVVSR